MDKGFKVHFDWQAWWASDYVGIIWFGIVWIPFTLMAIWFGIAERDWTMLGICGIAWAWGLIYCFGWQLLLLAILKLRVKLGLIAFRGADLSDR